MNFDDRTARLQKKSKAEDIYSDDCSRITSISRQNTALVTSAATCGLTPSTIASPPGSLSSPPLQSESAVLKLTGTATMQQQEQQDHHEDVDRNMPAGEIGRNTMKMLSQYLRPPKVNAKDWQDMAEEMGFNYQREIQNFKMEADPVERTISAWSTKRGSTVGRLLDILETIERDDVLQELPRLLEVDCRRWRTRREEAANPIQDPEVSGNYPIKLTTEELRGITLGDHPSGPPEMFDAYVCFTDADLEFVQELMRQLESPPHSLKLCIDPRDLLPGGSHALVTAEIIQNRCNKMLVILSPEFLQSASCDFQTKFAVSLEPGARTKRIIPVMVKPCTPPIIIKHITMCDFTKKDLRPWLWDRLRKAISLP